MPKQIKDQFHAERIARQFDALYRISAVVQKDMNKQDTFKSVLDVINEAVDYSSAGIFVLNRREKKLEELAKVGRKSDLISFVDFDLGKGFSSWVAKYRRPILMPDIKRYRESMHNHVRSFISVPIIVDGELIGVMNLSNERRASYDESDLHLVDVIASQIASLIERHYFRRELAERDLRINELEAMEGAPLKLHPENLLSEIQRWISIPIQSLSDHIKDLHSTLKGAVPNLIRNQARSSLAEMQKDVDKLSDFSVYLGKLTNERRPI